MRCKVHLVAPHPTRLAPGHLLLKEKALLRCKTVRPIQVCQTVWDYSRRGSNQPPLQNRALQLLSSCQCVIIALAVVGAAAVGGGEEAVHFVFVQVHHTIILVVFFVIVIIPAGIAFTLCHISPPKLRYANHHYPTPYSYDFHLWEWTQSRD